MQNWATHEGSRRASPPAPSAAPSNLVRALVPRTQASPQPTLFPGRVGDHAGDSPSHGRTCGVCTSSRLGPTVRSWCQLKPWRPSFPVTGRTSGG